MIYKLFSKNVPTMISKDIAIFVGTSFPYNVGFTRPHTHSHKHEKRMLNRIKLF